MLKIDQDFQHQSNIAAMPIANLNNVLRMVNGNPALQLDQLLPYKVPDERVEAAKFAVSSSTARAFLDCHQAGLLPEWMLANLAKYVVDWRKLVN